MSAPRAGEPPNPKQRMGDRKIPLHLVPPALMFGAARALREGAEKYGAYNWRVTKVEIMTYLGAIQRHWAGILDGEDVDHESTTGKLHLDGLAACCAILLDAYEGGFLIDNRPPPGPGARLGRDPGYVQKVPGTLETPLPEREVRQALSIKDSDERNAELHRLPRLVDKL